jgi:hypothetical protein
VAPRAPSYASATLPDVTLDPDDLEGAWSAVHAALPVGWSVGKPSNHDEERERPWHVFATDVRSRAKRREYVEATSWTATEALRDLAGLLRVWQVEQVDRAAD